MELFLDQNAATAAGLQELKEQVKADLAVHTEWKTDMSRMLQELAGQMKEAFLEFARRHNQLAERHDQLAKRHDQLAKRHDHLAAAHTNTQQEINILIKTVQEMLPRLPKP